MAAKKKVLLVDDSSTALMMEEMILTKYTGYEVITAQDGLTAVEKTANELPDLILMDLVMPLMDGLEACRRIRSNSRTTQIPIILVTSRAEQQCVESGFRSGCNDYITKPMKPEELVTVVQSYLEERWGDAMAASFNGTGAVKS